MPPIQAWWVPLGCVSGENRLSTVCVSRSGTTASRMFSVAQKSLVSYQLNPGFRLYNVKQDFAPFAGIPSVIETVNIEKHSR